MLHELRNAYNDTLAAKQRRRTSLQRLRPILQTARRKPTSSDAERRNTDEKTEAKKAVRGRERRGAGRRQLRPKRR